MLKPRGVTWEQQRTAVLAAGAPFYLATGSMTSADADSCRSYLDFLGSRLVFLIDWNRARKQLRQFLRGPDRVALLLSAAEADIGHRGFLELGGARLVNQAIEATAGSSMHFGDRLCDVLGDAQTVSFLRFVEPWDPSASPPELRSEAATATIAEDFHASLWDRDAPAPADGPPAARFMTEISSTASSLQL